MGRSGSAGDDRAGDAGGLMAERRRMREACPQGDGNRWRRACSRCGGGAAGEAGQGEKVRAVASFACRGALSVRARPLGLVGRARLVYGLSARVTGAFGADVVRGGFMAHHRGSGVFGAGNMRDWCQVGRGGIRDAALAGRVDDKRGAGQGFGGVLRGRSRGFLRGRSRGRRCRPGRVRPRIPRLQR